jgi:hypothetical protein
MQGLSPAVELGEVTHRYRAALDPANLPLGESKPLADERLRRFGPLQLAIGQQQLAEVSLSCSLGK